MSKIVTIKPSPLSKKFTSIIGEMQRYSENAGADGRVVSRSLGSYKQERLPNSSQIERPIAFSSQKKKWMLKDYDTNSDELNDLVKSCNLQNDMPKHYNFGRDILNCDIYNLNDPFFNHLQLKIKFSEGEGVLKLDTPKDKLLYAGALSNSRFQVSGDKLNPALTGRAKYILVDKEIDSKIKKESRGRKLEAIELLKEMTDEKKLTVALAMGLVKDERVDSAIIDDLLWEAVEDATNKYADSNTTKQEYFIKIAKSDNEDLSTRRTIQKAISSGIIKKDRETNSFTAFGGHIGKDRQQVVTFLLKPENSDLLFRIDKALENYND